METTVAYAPKILSGVDVIDEAWGGLYRGGSYLVYGRAATGRGLLTMMFVQTGAMLEERCLFISPDRPKDLMIQAASMGFNLRQAYEADLVKLMRIPPMLNLQEIGDEGVSKALNDLVSIIRQNRPDRLVINDFMPFVQFRSFDRFRAAFVQMLEQIDSLDTTMMLVMAEPANQQSRKVIDFMRNQMTGAVHIELVEEDANSTKRRLTLIPNIGHIRRRVVEFWDLQEVVEEAEENVSSSVRMLPGSTPRATERAQEPEQKDHRRFRFADLSTPRAETPEPTEWAPPSATTPEQAPETQRRYAYEAPAEQEISHPEIASKEREATYSETRKALTEVWQRPDMPAAATPRQEVREAAPAVTPHRLGQTRHEPEPQIRPIPLGRKPREVRPEPPQHREPERRAYREPEPPQYREPEPPQYREPELPQYRVPEPPKYREPEPPQYREPERPAYREPEPPQYREPERPAFREEPAYRAPEPPVYRAPEPPPFREEEVYRAPEPPRPAPEAPRSTPERREPKEEAFRPTAEPPRPSERSFEPSPAPERPSHTDRDAFRTRLQQHFLRRDVNETPFLLIAMRMDRSQERSARPFDFEFILDLVSELLRDQDDMFVDLDRERLIVLLADSRPEAAQRFFAQLKNRLREEAPQQADHLLHSVSAIVVPDGRPFQNAEEFLTYALDEA